MDHNLFNQCRHFAYGDAAMRLKCVRHSKNAIFTHNFAMSSTPVAVNRNAATQLYAYSHWLIVKRLANHNNYNCKLVL